MVWLYVVLQSPDPFLQPRSGLLAGTSPFSASIHPIRPPHPSPLGGLVVVALLQRPPARSGLLTHRHDSTISSPTVLSSLSPIQPPYPIATRGWARVPLQPDPASSPVATRLAVSFFFRFLAARFASGLVEVEIPLRQAFDLA